MSIRFSCELTDPHVEALLRFLSARLDDDTSQILAVVKCAKEWLEMQAPNRFDRSCDGHMSSSLVLVDDEDDIVSPAPSQMPSQSHLG